MNKTLFLHKFQRITTLTSILLTVLTISSYPAIALDTFYIAQNPPTESNQCRAVLARSLSQIKKKKHRIVYIKREKHGYKDHPENRYLAYLIVVEDKGSLLRSDVFLTAISTDIISNCKSIGLVRFGYDHSDFIDSYGLMRNGKVEGFQCSNQNHPKWGYQWCP